MYHKLYSVWISVRGKFEAAQSWHNHDIEIYGGGKQAGCFLVIRDTYVHSRLCILQFSEISAYFLHKQTNWNYSVDRQTHYMYQIKARHDDNIIVL